MVSRFVVAFVCLISLYPGYAEDGLELIGVISDGKGDRNISYASSPLAGMPRHPSDIWINEREGIMAIIDTLNKKIKIFDLATLELKHVFVLPFMAERYYSIFCGNGYVFLNDEMWAIRVYNYKGEFVFKFSTPDNHFMPIYQYRSEMFVLDKDEVLWKYLDGKLIKYEREKAPKYFVSLLGTSNSIFLLLSDTAKEKDYFYRVSL